MELWEREDLAAARDAGVEFWPGQRVSVGTLPGVVVSAEVTYRLTVNAGLQGDWRVKHYPRPCYTVQLDAGPRVTVSGGELSALEAPTPPGSYRAFSERVYGALVTENGDARLQSLQRVQRRKKGDWSQTSALE